MSQITRSSPVRRYDIDWLRIIAVLLLIPFHTARCFDSWEANYVENAVKSEFLTYFSVYFIGLFHMPLFFILAGASTYFALDFRKTGQYIKERFLRLFVPLIFGVLVIVPPQPYLAARMFNGYTGSFFQFYPEYWATGFADLTGYRGTFTPGHLWFILYLFIISLVALPILNWFRGERGRAWLERFAGFLSRPGMIFLPSLLIGLLYLTPGIDSKNPLYFLSIFVFGYILMADKRLEEAIDRQKGVALIAAIPGYVFLLWLNIYDIQPASQWSLMLIKGYLNGPACWVILIALLGYGRKFLNVDNPVRRYASAAAYPFYIFHQTVIIAVAYFVVRWQISIAAKFTLIQIAATAGSLLLYELIRQTNITRFFFGMKPLKKKRPIEPAAQPT